MKKVLPILILISVLLGCSKPTPYETIDTSGINYILKINRLEKDLLKIKNLDNAKLFISKHPEFNKYYLSPLFPSQRIRAQKVLGHSQLKDMDVLTNEALERLGDFNLIERELEEAFKKIKVYDKNFEFPLVNTFITNYTDNFLFISKDRKYLHLELSWFNDSSSTYPPPTSVWGQYILDHFKKENFAPKVITEFGVHYASSNTEDLTMINEMILGGKILFFVKQMLPDKDDRFIMEYTPAQIDYCNKFQKPIWNFFLQKQLLYETNSIEKRKYNNPRPKVPEINEACPGRIGMYFGWKIVESYMLNHPEVTLEELMDNMDHKKIFMESGFKPE